MVVLQYLAQAKDIFAKEMGGDLVYGVWIDNHESVHVRILNYVCVLLVRQSLRVILEKLCHHNGVLLKIK